MRNYSQNNEQATILEHFAGKTDGRWLDIGAYDGVAFSNTRALAEMGWSGVAVEPSPSAFIGLMNCYRGNPRVTLVQAAIVPDDAMPGFMEFHDSGGDAISTLNQAHRDKWATNCGSKFVPFQLKPVIVSEFFNAFGGDFEFLNLDVEATNWEIFKCLPLATMPSLKLICVEHDFRDRNMLLLAHEYGFRELMLNGENLILGR